MSQRQLAKPLARRWPSIILTTLIGVGLAVLWLNLATPRYTAHADVLVSPPAAKSTDAVAERTIASSSFSTPSALAMSFSFSRLTAS